MYTAMRTSFFLMTAAVTMIAAAETHQATIRDVTGRGFPPSLVRYRMATPPENAAGLRLLDAAGAVVPSQVRRTQGEAWELSFVTSLPADGGVRFSLDDRSALSMPGTGLVIGAHGDELVLGNRQFAIRCPAPRNDHFETAVPAAQLPAPISGFRHGPGDWLGGGRILSLRPVISHSVRLTAQGPVFSELVYLIEFDGGGWYRATIRVVDRLPYAEVREEYDTGDLGGNDFWELDLTSNWETDMIEVGNATSGTGFERSSVAPLASLGVTPEPIQPAWVIVPDSSWYSPRTHLGLFSQAARQDDPQAYPVAGFVPLHKGDWRRTNAVEIHTPDARQVALRLPMSVRHASWLREITSETSPFSIHEHDPGLPTTYGRRVWALVLAHPDIAGLNPNVAQQQQGGVPRGPMAMVRVLYGIVGLDRYKDYVLDWPDQEIEYPRVFLQPDEVDLFRDNIGRSPLETTLRRHWIPPGEDDDAQGRAVIERARREIDQHVRYMLGTPTVGHHAMSGSATKAAAVDLALAWPDLPLRERAELRAKLALAVYLYQEGDVVSYANGSHTGPPNMGVAVSGPMGAFLGLLPDHPMSDRWLEHMAAYLEYRAGANMAPGGGWFEYGGAYHMHGIAPLTNGIVGLAAARAANRETLLDYLALDWQYYMDLLTPYDSRWGARMVPGLANSMPSFSGHFMEASGALHRSHPELAANLRWAWFANGLGDNALNPMLERPWMEPVEPRLRSRIYPGVGVIFRAHQGERETYMFLRAGYNWSHWTEDQGHFMLMSDGATLMPFQSYQYGRSANPEFDVCNILRFGHPANRFPHSWPDANVLDHAFGDTADYAWVSVGFPDWYIEPGTDPDFAPPPDAAPGQGQVRPLAEGVQQTPGPFTWDRQVVFLKRMHEQTPDIFVFRDTTSGPGELAGWMNFNLLGKEEHLTVDSNLLSVETEWPVTLHLEFPETRDLEVDTYEQAFNISVWGRSHGLSPFRDGQPASPRWVRQDGSPFTEPSRESIFEQHLMLRLEQPAGLDAMWLLWPGREASATPVVEQLAPGVLRISTGEETAFVFMGRGHMEFRQDDLVFAGRAGIIRLHDGQVTLALLGGPGNVGYRGHVIEGEQPFEQTLPLSELQPGHHSTATRSPIEFSPRLTGHAPVAPGVERAQDGDSIEYLVTADHPLQFADDTVSIEADDAAVLVSPDSVRFIARTTGYVRLAVGNVAVRGLGPFDLTFTDTRIAGTVDGRARTLVCTWPRGITRPMYHMNGRRWFAGFGDNHTIVKDTPEPQFALAFGVDTGPREIEIAEWTYPQLPPAPSRRTVDLQETPR